MLDNKEQLNALLEDSTFRRAFLADYVQEILAAQIRAIREHRGLTQEQLGEAAEGMSQVQVSRLENPDYPGATVNSLRRIAQAFDVGLIIRCAPFSEFVDWVVNQSAERLVPPSFLEEQSRLRVTPVADILTSIDAVASAVSADQPDLPRLVGAAPDGTVTILFTDIEGSTPIAEHLGDQRWVDLLHTHNAIIREQLAAHGGFEVKSQGDGFMAAFQSARRALQCAVAIQRSLATYNNQHHEEPIRVRTGLHTGEAVKEADDFFGKAVVLAARIAAQAQGGQILVSGLLKELTESSGQFRFDEGRDVALKGLSGSHKVFEMEWE